MMGFMKDKITDGKVQDQRQKTFPITYQEVKNEQKWIEQNAIEITSKGTY